MYFTVDKYSARTAVLRLKFCFFQHLERDRDDPHPLPKQTISISSGHKLLAPALRCYYRKEIDITTYALSSTYVLNTFLCYPYMSIHLNMILVSLLFFFLKQFGDEITFFRPQPYTTNK